VLIVKCCGVWVRCVEGAKGREGVVWGGGGGGGGWGGV